MLTKLFPPSWKYCFFSFWSRKYCFWY